MFTTRSTLAILLTLASPCVAQVQSGVSPAMRSATKARDVGGFTLGMNIRDAARLALMENIGNGDYQTLKDGIRYDLGVTQLGRIYRVDSEQNLGRFVIDDAFLSALRSKLTVKYGQPVSATSATFGWSLIESVKRTGDRALPFETNWAAAYIEGGSEGVTLHVKLLDFRIMWQDERAVNRPERQRAVNRVAF